MIDEALTGTVPAATAESVPPHYPQALQRYQDHQALIEARVWQVLQRAGLNDVAFEHFRRANGHLSQDIAAALRLGNMDFINAEISWTEKLIKNYDIPVKRLQQYIAAYYEAASEYLTEPDCPVVAWLAELSGRQA